MGMPAAIPYYTVEDLEGFPDDGNRYELVDGVLLVTPAPEPFHQLIAARLITMLSMALDSAQVVGPGVVVRTPRTQLQPDVLVYPARWGRRAKWTDILEHLLAVEIYSPSSRIYDREFKLKEYFRLGVQEVWLVDPDEETLECHTTHGAGLVAEQFEWMPEHFTQVSVDVHALFRS